MLRRNQIIDRIRALFGPDSIPDSIPDGAPVVAPRTEAATALMMQTATAEHWRVRVQGEGGWMPQDAPADLTLSTNSLRDIADVSAPDLVATAQAGVSWSTLKGELADSGAWLAHDPPGGDRTLGSILVTGTAGPLRAGYGSLRDHVLGLTVVTGDGRVVRSGGRVMKNVAGYDLAKLVVGSFGAFGVVTSVHLRLRAVPRADITLTAQGSRDDLLDACGAVIAAGLTPAALEVFSPVAGQTPDWCLGIRALGTATEVSAEQQLLSDAAGLHLHPLEGEAAAGFWYDRSIEAARGPITLRLGGVPSGVDRILDLIAYHLDEAVEDWISVTVPAGMVRWSGDASAEHLRALRHAAAAQEMPLTIERAPWSVRKELGHFGAYREGTARLVSALRQTFDPGHVIQVPTGRDGE
jgi:glycolate oxidase FAD binding subunit